MSRTDLIATTFALAAHASLAFGLLHVHEPVRKPNGPIEFDVRKIPPPPPPVVMPVPLPPPPPKVVMKQKAVKAPESVPPPNATPPKTPPAEPPKPVFGITTASTTDSDSSFSVPVGNTTMIDPSKSGKGTAAPLPAAAAPTGPPAYKPVSELYIKTLPEDDSDACARSVTYPEEARSLGIEGDVRLRVALDEFGKVHDVKVLSGLGHGLDQAAMNAIKHRCKFTAAIATDGKPVPFVIPLYVFHFEIAR